MNEDTSLDFFTQWIDSYLNFERTPKKGIFWLDTMKFLCEKLGHPENCCPCFHVAGSKGKGSISVMIAGILEERGLRTGIYTSPHILDFKERVGYFNGSFDYNVYRQSAQELISTVEAIPVEEFPMQRPVTWFELVTLFAMLCFRNAHVDFAVWEVGLGGRLDATNVVHPACCCIGPIELEHTEYLGDTLAKIAAEKGGIIKDDVPVICAPQKEEASHVLREIADLHKSPLIFVDKIIHVYNTVYKCRIVESDSTEKYTGKKLPSVCMDAEIFLSTFKRSLNLSLKMPGLVQIQNAAVAAEAVRHVFPDISESVVEKGLSKVSLPARFEVIGCEQYPDIPFIVLDGAHTANSIYFTMDTYENIFGCSEFKKPNLLFACAADKDIEDICKCFKGRFGSIVLTRPGNVKQSDTERAEKAFQTAGLQYIYMKDYNKAIRHVLDNSCFSKTPLLVTGSFYLIAEVKKYLLSLSM